jgi:hypothetical protein
LRKINLFLGSLISVIVELQESTDTVKLSLFSLAVRLKSDPQCINSSSTRSLSFLNMFLNYESSCWQYVAFNKIIYRISRRYPRAYARGPMNFSVFYFQSWHSTTGSRTCFFAIFDKIHISGLTQLYPFLHTVCFT